MQLRHFRCRVLTLSSWKPASTVCRIPPGLRRTSTSLPSWIFEFIFPCPKTPGFYPRCLLTVMTISTRTSDPKKTGRRGRRSSEEPCIRYDLYSMWQEIKTVVNYSSFYSRYDDKIFTVFQTGNGRLALILYFWTIFLIFGLSPSYAACVNEDLVDLDILARPGYCRLNFFNAFLRTKLAKPCDRVATSPMNKATLKNLILAL